MYSWISDFHFFFLESIIRAVTTTITSNRVSLYFTEKVLVSNIIEAFKSVLKVISYQQLKQLAAD